MPERLFIESQVNGNLIEVVAIMTSVQNANAYCERLPEMGVIGEHNGMIYIARCSDLGVPMPDALKRRKP